MPKALFEQDKIGLPVTKLATVRDIIWTEQNADITIKLRLLALSGPAWTTRIAMLGQVPPQLLIHAFFRVDVAIDCFLADAQFGTFIDHPVADLFGCPFARQAIWQSQICREGALFDPRNHGLAQIRMSDQLALY